MIEGEIMNCNHRKLYTKTIRLSAWLPTIVTFFMFTCSIAYGQSPASRTSGFSSEPSVQVANLVYAGTKSSRCFADHFLIAAERDGRISTSRRFHAVKMADKTIFDFPLLIMTGEGDFQLTEKERDNIKRYVDRGGMLVASAGCSSSEWSLAFRREMAAIFTDTPLKPIEMSHPMFHTVYDIDSLRARHGEPRPLEGITVAGRLGVVYSPDGLNDTSHTEGCCCCGGNELADAERINVNILAYSLIY